MHIIVVVTYMGKNLKQKIIVGPIRPKCGKNIYDENWEHHFKDCFLPFGN